MDNRWVATDACTLPTVEQPLRAAEFDALFASSLIDVRRLDATHLRLVLRGPAGLGQRVQDLADQEAECCSFFTFSLTGVGTNDDDAPVTRFHLDIEVPAERADVLEAIADRALVGGATGSRP
ncbi:MAG: hypothetical protein ABJA81_04015 [Nocardioidaceae bacterium]